MIFDSLRAPRARRIGLSLSVLAYAGTLLLTACGGGGSSDATAPSAPSAAESARKLHASGMAQRFAAPRAFSDKVANAIAVTATSSPDTSTVQLKLPAGADAKSLAVTLNGHDISARFSSSDCAGAVCMTANVGAGDGYAMKNVVSAYARKTTGGMASGRARFAGASIATGATPATKATATSTKAKALAASPDVCDTTTMCPPWLPPSVAFKTSNAGGWTMDSNPWFQIGNQTFPSAPPPSNCTGAQYAAVVLDRQTLVERTTSPESSPQCFANEPALKTYLTNSVTSADLVVVGTVWGQNASASLDTTAIGGSSYASSSQVPMGYMAIGAGGQGAGSAYEMFYDSNTGDPSFNVFATGTLQEDANGNYNFQSSDIVEYAISPNDPAYFMANTTQSAIAMNIPTNLASVTGETRRVYMPPETAPNNGLWLLLLDRTSMQPSPNQPDGTAVGCYSTAFAPSSTNTVFRRCGTTCAVAGDVPAATRDKNWTQLAKDLSAVGPYQIAMLVSINSVGTTDQPTTFQSHASTVGFRQFSAALQKVGGTYTLVAGPKFDKTDSYSLVGYAGAANPLSGGAAEASTMLAQQGQFGVLHGILQRNRNGLYQPSQVSQEPQPVFAAKGGLDGGDFALLTQSFQQPVEWPSNSASNPLPGATLDGQRAAYRFISHWLLAGYYAKGIQGPHQDDLHYFFSGSLNTWIDYHTMDPVNLPFPSPGQWDEFGCLISITPGTCNFIAPGDSAPSSFTTADFNAVKAQMSLEVQYLTNTLQFLVTGSTNMKDVIAAGNANVGLALTSAASTILGSDLANKDRRQRRGGACDPALMRRGPPGAA